MAGRRGDVSLMEYRLDTHVHTSEVSSCARVPANEVPRRYKAAGYGGVVVTDHYYDGFFQRRPDASWPEQVDAYVEGYRVARGVGEAIGLDVFLGMELRFSGEGYEDYLVYGHDEAFLLAHPHLEAMSLEAFHELARSSGMVIFQAHPFRPGLRRARPDLLDGMETINGNPRHNSHNDEAGLFADSNGLVALSGSDFHEVEDVARGGVILPRRPSSGSDLARMLIGCSLDGSMSLIGGENAFTRGLPFRAS